VLAGAKFNTLPIPRRSPVERLPVWGQTVGSPTAQSLLPEPGMLLDPGCGMPRVGTSVAHRLTPLPPADCRAERLERSAQHSADDQPCNCEKQHRHV
jgi:hypothetical protein